MSSSEVTRSHLDDIVALLDDGQGAPIDDVAEVVAAVETGRSIDEVQQRDQSATIARISQELPTRTRVQA